MQQGILMWRLHKSTWRFLVSYHGHPTLNMDSILSVYVGSQVIGSDIWPSLVMGLTLQEISQYLLCKDKFLQTSYANTSIYTTSVQGIYQEFGILADSLHTVTQMDHRKFPPNKTVTCLGIKIGLKTWNPWNLPWISWHRSFTLRLEDSIQSLRKDRRLTGSERWMPRTCKEWSQHGCVQDLQNSSTSYEFNYSCEKSYNPFIALRLHSQASPRLHWPVAVRRKLSHHFRWSKAFAFG